MKSLHHDNKHSLHTNHAPVFPPAHGPQSLAQKRHPFTGGLALRGLRPRHQVPGQARELASHDQRAHLNKREAVKHDCAVLLVLVQVFLKRARELRPVQRGHDVVRDVVPVVERARVQWCVNRAVGQLVIVVGVGGVDKDVLRPVAKHEEERPDDERRAKQPRCQRGVVRKDCRKDHCAGDDGARDFQHEPAAAVAPRKERQLDPHAQEEAQPVQQKVPDAVALVRLGRAQVVRTHVVLAVVHGDVVRVVRARGDPVKRRKDPQRHGVERRAVGQLAVRGVVQRENEALVEEREVACKEHQPARVRARVAHDSEGKDQKARDVAKQSKDGRVARVAQSLQHAARRWYVVFVALRRMQVALVERGRGRGHGSRPWW